MNRILAISDIHGCLDQFNKLLHKVNYNKDTDKLYILGDYTDRGLQSKGVLNKVIELVDNGAVAIRGNHDQLLLNWLNSDEGEHAVNFFRNGGFQTVTSYVGYDMFPEGYDWDLMMRAKNYIKEHYHHHIELLQSLPYYIEDGGYVFVHAGVYPFLDDWKNSSLDDFIWIREPFLYNNHDYDNIFIHGHTPTINLHDTADIYYGNKKIGIDGGCVFGYQLNCLEITEEGFKQYDVVNEKVTD